MVVFEMVRKCTWSLRHDEDILRAQTMFSQAFRSQTLVKRTDFLAAICSSTSLPLVHRNGLATNNTVTKND